MNFLKLEINYNMNPSISSSISFANEISAKEQNPIPSRKRKINAFQHQPNATPELDPKIQRTSSLEEQIEKINEIISKVRPYWEWKKSTILCEKIKPLLNNNWGFYTRDYLHDLLKSQKATSCPEDLEGLQKQDGSLRQLINQLDCSGNNPLLFELFQTLIQNSEEELIKVMLSRGLTLDTKEELAQKCLIEASGSNVRIAKLVLQPTMDLNFSLDCTIDFLELAELHKDLELAKLVSSCHRNNSRNININGLRGYVSRLESLEILEIILEQNTVPQDILLSYAVSRLSRSDSALAISQRLFSKVDRKGYICTKEGNLEIENKHIISIVTYIRNAISNHDMKAVVFLLDVAGNNIFQNPGLSLLYSCIKSESYDIYNFLQEKYTNYDQVLWDILTDTDDLLKTDIKITKQLITHLIKIGSDFNSQFKKSKFYGDSLNDQTPLEGYIYHISQKLEVDSGHEKFLEILKFLIDSGAQLPKCSEKLKNLVFEYSRKCRLEGLKYILELSKKSLSKEDYGQLIDRIMTNILLYKHDEDEFEFLISQVTDYTQVYQDSVFLLKYNFSLANKRLDRLKQLGANVNKTINGVPLFLAVFKKNIQHKLDPYPVLDVMRNHLEDKTISACDSNGFNLTAYSCFAPFPQFTQFNPNNKNYFASNLILSISSFDKMTFNSKRQYNKLFDNWFIHPIKSFDPFKFPDEMLEFYEYMQPSVSELQQRYLKTSIYNSLYTWDAGYQSYIDSFSETVQNDDPSIAQINCVAEMKKMKNLSYGKRTLPKGIRTYEDFYKCFQQIIDCFENRTPRQSTPTAQQPKELIEFYQKLEKMLQFWIHSCIKSNAKEYDPDEAWILMFNLVEVSQICSTAWIQEIHQKYSILTSKKVKSIKDQIYTCVSCMRHGIITNWGREHSSQLSQELLGYESHYGTGAISKYGREWGIVTSNLVEEHLRKLSAAEGLAVSNYFNSHNKPSQILTTVKSDIKLGNINEDALIEILKDTYIGEWKSKEYIEKKESFLKEIHPSIKEAFLPNQPKNEDSPALNNTQESQSAKFKKLWEKIASIGGIAKKIVEKEQSESKQRDDEVVINLRDFKETIERHFNASTSYDDFIKKFLPVLDKGVETSRKDDFSSVIYDKFGKLKDEYLIRFLLDLKIIKFQNHLGMDKLNGENVSPISALNRNIQFYIKLSDRLDFLTESKEHCAVAERNEIEKEMKLIGPLMSEQMIALKWRLIPRT